MDEQNIHQFWGFSPSTDLLSVGSKGGTTNILQVAPYDPRHTIQTMCQASRHDSADTVHVYVYEDNPEALARHILLLGILLDTSLLASDRVTMFLEVYGNLFIREETSNYLQRRSKQLENIISIKISGSDSGDNDLMGQLLDLSSMRFEAKDQLVSAIVQARSAPSIDLKHAWDTRSRKWYGDRYDFRKNAIDWDYHMRLVEADADPPGCHIIHFSHFRHWRMTGLAFEVRDCQYNTPNSTLISAAVGRTKDFKNTKCEDVGRSVVARGLWCDIVCSPYHTFGVTSEESSLLEVSNKQFKHTAVEIARHNVHAFLRELRGEEKATMAASLSGAKPSRGPTTAEDLQDAMKAQSLEEETSASQPTASQNEPAENSEKATVFLPLETAAVTGGSPPTIGNNDTTIVAQTSTATQGDQQQAALASSTTAAASEHVLLSCKSEQTAEQEQKILEQQKLEDSLNAVLAERAGRFRLHFVCGDFVKQLSGKRALKGFFNVATVGVMHAHLLRGQHKLGDALAPGAVVLVESAQNLIQVNKDALQQFRGTVAGWAGEIGLRLADSSDSIGSVPAKVVPFVKDPTASGG